MSVKSSSKKVSERPSFQHLIKQKWEENKFVCVGLDSQYDKIPEFIREGKDIDEAMFSFNKEIIEKTNDLVCAYKPQYAFYGAQGQEGISALIRTIKYIHNKYPSIPVIVDAKRNDIGNTAKQYAKEIFDVYKADAVTTNPYLGSDGLNPFLEREGKGLFILCRTSNPSAKELQDLQVEHPQIGEVPFYQAVAYQTANQWNQSGQCGMVIGATYPKELAEIREIAPDIPLLIPGIGEQGGDVKKTVQAGQDSNGQGMVINSSRSIIFASEEKDFAKASREATQNLSNLITKFL